MLKKMLATVFVLGATLSSGAVLAQYCGGEIEVVGDLVGNNRAWNISCCPEGYRVHGVACADLPPDQDFGDGCTAVCRSTTAGNTMQPNADFQRVASVFQCQPSEVMVGIICKDAHGVGTGQNSDVADGCTPVCQNPTSKATRDVLNADIAGNPRSESRVMAYGSKRVVGIACQDLQKGSSDRLDGCTLIVK